MPQMIAICTASKNGPIKMVPVEVESLHKTANGTPVLAVHRPPSGVGWQVTHVPTGLLVTGWRWDMAPHPAFMEMEGLAEGLIKRFGAALSTGDKDAIKALPGLPEWVESEKARLDNVRRPLNQGEDMLTDLPVASRAPAPGCEACGLYKNVEHPLISVRVDGRKVIAGRSAEEFPLVLLVLSQPTEWDDRTGMLLGGGVVGDLLLDYLEGLEARWVATALVRCCPGPATSAGAKHIKACSHFLETEVLKWDPAVVLAFGGKCINALWPAERGTPPSVTRSRTMPVKMASGAWLLGAFDPRSHEWWLESQGKSGQDLTGEYIATFSLVDQLVCGSYAKQTIEYTPLETQAEFDRFCTELEVRGVTWMTVDIEDDTWISSGSKPMRPYNHPQDYARMYGQFTKWHPENQLTAFGVTVEWDGEVRNFQVEPGLLLRGEEPFTESRNLIRLLCGRHVDMWNGLYDIVGMWIFCGVNVLRYVASVGDGMFRHGLADQSISGNSLEAVAMGHFGCPSWKHPMYEALKEVRETTGLPVSSMGEVARDTRRLYNAGDTCWDHRVVRERQLVGDPTWSAVAYQELIDGLPFVVEMEVNGLPVSPEVLNVLIDTYMEGARKHTVALKQTPEFVRTCKALGFDPGEWSPKKKRFYARFIAETGVVVTAETATGMPSQTAEVVRALAGEGDETGLGAVPWGEKNHQQKVWTVWHRITRYEDDAKKFMLYRDYTVNRRIHAQTSMLRAERENLGGQGKAIESGAVSGRFSTTPNDKNFRKDWEFTSFLVAPEGWSFAVFDFSQNELVWIAYNTGDELLRQWIVKGRDMHLEKGARLYALAHGSDDGFWNLRSREECALLKPHPQQKPWRDKGKTDNFAFAYMQEPETQAVIMGVEVEEAYDLCRASDAMHPAILAKKHELYEMLQRGDKAVTTVFQRRRSAPLWTPSRMGPEQFFSWDPDMRNRRNHTNLSQFRSVWNTWAAQADSSDHTFCAGKRIKALLDSGTWLERPWVEMINFEHDSLWFLVKDHYLPTVVPAIMGEMVRTDLYLPEHVAPVFDLPVRVSATTGAKFNEMEEWK